MTLDPKRPWAVLVGKFMPPHIGHEYLIALACELAERVTVIVGNTVQSEGAMPAELRGRWLKQHFGERIEVVVPPEGDISTLSAQQVIDLARKFFDSVFGEQRPDIVVGADDHTAAFAQLAGARAVIADTVLIRATAIRAAPLAHWDEILPPARPHFLNETVVIAGPATLDRASLAAAAQGILVVRGDRVAGLPLAAQIRAARRVARRALLVCLPADPELDLSPLTAAPRDGAGHRRVFLHGEVWPALAPAVAEALADRRVEPLVDDTDAWLSDMLCGTLRDRDPAGTWPDT